METELEKINLVNMNESPSGQQTIGEFISEVLKTSRLKLFKISQRTKINPSILKALQENNLQELPNITYVKGFVKAFCKETGGDIERAMAALETTYQNMGPLESKKVSLFASIDEEESEEKNNWQSSIVIAQQVFSAIGLKKIKIIAVAAVVIGVLYWAVHLFDSPTPSTQTEVIKPTIEPVTVEKSSAVVPVEAENLEKKSLEFKEKLKKIADSGSDENAPTMIVDEVQTNTPPLRQSSIELPTKLRFTQMVLPLYELVPREKNSDDYRYLPENIQNAFIEGKQNIFINATSGDTWLTYKNGSGPIKTFTLKKGRTLLIRGDEIRVFLGNVNVTKIFYNNTLIKINTRNGVKSLVFPQKAANKFVTPLFIRDIHGRSYTSSEYLSSKKDSDNQT